jgi:hypothetical protein
VLTEDQKNINSQQRQESWDFAYRLYPPDVIAAEAGRIDSKIVEKGAPYLESNGRTDGENHQKLEHRLSADVFHFFSMSLSTGMASQIHSLLP